MIQKIRERLTLALIILLPFHAFIITVLTKIIAGPSRAPLGSLATWKEGLLAVILLLAGFEILQNIKRMSLWKIDFIDALIIILMILGFVITAKNQLSLIHYIFGFKYDFIPLISFLFLRRVNWSEEFKNRVIKSIIAIGLVLAVCGIISFFLPQSFFRFLGYSDLHSLYQPDGPLAPYQQIGGTFIRRIQSTMSGPNQLGLWLLLPWSAGLMNFFGTRGIKNKKFVGGNCRDAKFYVSTLINKFFIFYFLFFILTAVALILTFSRSAYIAATIILIAVLWINLPKKTFIKYTAAITSLGIVIIISSSLLFPGLIFRFASSRDHWLRPLAALEVIKENPLGSGLATAGPASNRLKDTCVYLEAGADTSWAQAHPQLCVFVKNEQVQPTDYKCSCPFLPENWYLQLGVEMGGFGFLLFTILTFLIILKLITKNQQSKTKQQISLLTFLGISVACLFLHAWEDSAVAYTAWFFLSFSLPQKYLKAA